MLDRKSKTIEYFLYGLAFLVLISLFFYSNPNSKSDESLYNFEAYSECSISAKNLKNKAENENLKVEIFYFPISITSDISNIKCIGKVKNFSINNDKVIINSYHSIRFYNIFSGILSLLFIFLIKLFNFKNKTLFIFYVLTFVFVFQYIFIYQNALNLLNFFSIVSPILLYFIYFHYLQKNKDLSNDWLFKASFCLLVYLLFWEYQYFSNFLILFCLIFYKRVFRGSLEKEELKFIKFIPIYFYLLRLISNFFEYLNPLNRRLSGNIYETDLRFLDLQNPINAINCNVYKFNNLLTLPKPQKYNFSKDVLHVCPYETFYGPIIDNFLRFKISNIFMVGLIITIICFLIIGIYYIRQVEINKKASFFLFILAIGPPTNFLLERMNLDIIIFIVLYICLKDYKTNTFAKAFILTVLVFLKYYTIVVFGALILVSMHLKNKQKTAVSFGYFLVTLFSFYVFHFLSSSNNKILGVDFSSSELDTGTIDYELILGGWMDGLTMSFGNLAHARNINELFNIGNLLLVYLVLTNLYLIAIVIFYRKNKFIKLNFEENSFINFSVIVIFVFVSLYSNYDYRLPLLILIWNFIYTNGDKYLKYVFLIFYVTSVSNYLVFEDFEGFFNMFDITVNTLIIIINFLSFSYVFSFFSALIIRVLSKFIRKKEGSEKNALSSL